MGELSGLVNASGLSAENKPIIAQLVSVYDGVASRNRELCDYYDGRIAVRDFGAKVDSETLKNDAVCFWPQKAVDVLAERIRFDGYVMDDGKTDPVLDSIMTRNRIVNAYRRYTPSKLMHGCMFGVVNSLNGKAQVKFHSAETAAAIPDGNHDSGAIGAGLVIARRALVAQSSKPVPVVVNVYLPGSIIVISRNEGASTWTAKEHGVEERDPMMFAFTHKSSGHRPFGTSRISRSLRGYTRAAMRTMYHMEASGAFYAFPKLMLMGLTDEQYEEMKNSKQKAYVDNVLLGTMDVDGNRPTPYQFSGNSPQPFIDELRYYAGCVSGDTGVPLVSLGIPQDNPSSAEAITNAREDLCLTAEQDCEDDREVLNRIMKLALAVESNMTTDELVSARPECATIMAHFQSPFVYSQASKADSALKIASAAPWYPNTDVFLEELGFDAPTIARMRRARDEYAAGAVIDALFAQADRGQEANRDEGSTVNERV